MTRVGLRIDVDTFRGTREGVPRLLATLAAADVAGTFFFTVGPDNMGRHLWRLLRPSFLAKMLRSRAASLYGWDILLRGTFWPGPQIGRALGGVIRDADRAGHEVGLHGWDHHRWQVGLERFDDGAIRRETAAGMDALTEILGRRPRCSASPGWRCDERVIAVKEEFGFLYNSDCRGRSLFRPLARGRACALQVPVTLPTFDEFIGRDGVDTGNYNRRLLDLVRPDALNVLTIHAEVEGGVHAGLFADFLRQGRDRGLQFVPLRELLPSTAVLPVEPVHLGPLPGRADTVCWQGAPAAAA